MQDRHEFIASLFALGSLEMLSSFEAIAADPKGELPTMRALGALGRFMSGPPPELSTSMIKVALPKQEWGDFPARMWEKHRIWLSAGEGDGKIRATIRFSLPIYVRKLDLDRTVELLKAELKA